MFKSNDNKKHRKRSLMNFQCAPGKCASTDEKDNDFYEVSTDQQEKVINKTVEYNVRYNLEDAPSHLIRKTMKYEETRSHRSGDGVDVVDNAGTSSHHVTKTYSLEYPSALKKSSKVKLLQGKKCEKIN